MFDFLDDALGLASAGAGLASLFGGGDGLHGWQERGLKGATRRNTEIAEMLQNPQDPRFLSAVGEEEELVRSGAQSGIRELMVADQRQRARGLSGLLEPERRDEGIASATATAFEQARNEARNRVRAYLESAANVNASLYGGIPQSIQPQGINTNLLGIAGAFDLARAGLGAFNGGGAPNTGSVTNINIPGGQQGYGLPSIYGGAGARGY